MIMKKVVAFISFIVLLGVIHAQAQSTPVVDERQHHQRHRIRQGVRTGELTRVEAQEARGNQRKVRRTERRAKADGVVTGRERVRIHHKQNKASRALYKDKHDGQERKTIH
jgi:hypothetical protein